MKKGPALLFIALLLSLHVYLGRDAIKKMTPTFDEPVHITAGYVYNTTAHYYFLGLDHPPFGQMLATLPLLFIKPHLPTESPLWLAQKWESPEQYQFADDFVFKNATPWRTIVESTRSMQLLLSVLLGIALAIAAFHLGGWEAAVVSTAFWALSPTMLAHGTLVTTDLAFAFFFFLFFVLAGDVRTPGRILAAGVTLGLAVASKYFFIVMIPCLLALLALRLVQKEKVTKEEALRWFLVAAIGFVVLTWAYQYGKLSLFERGVRYAFKRAKNGDWTYFRGEIRKHGWLMYFPYAFAVKTSIPLLIGIAAAITLAVRRKLTIPPRLWIPPIVYFVLVCNSHKQVGHRHLLPIYPFLFLAAGLALARLKGKTKILTGVLLVWLSVETAIAKPNYLSYFNEFVGGSKNGYHSMIDSNVDWGQALRELSETLTPEEREKGIYLSYFGVVDPHIYGIKYFDVNRSFFPPHEDDAKDSALAPTTLAISVSHYQMDTPGTNAKFSWLKSRAPKRLVGNSILMYDFSDDAEARDKLAILVGNRR